MKIIFYVCCSFLLYSQSVIAAEDIFVHSSQEIIDGLSAKKSTPRKTRSLSSFKSAHVPVKKRDIVRLKEPQSGQSESIAEAVQVPVDSNQPHVNLKIEFDVNSYAVLPASFPLLAELGKAVVAPELVHKKITIIGHTDADGNEEYNLRLSYNRAKSVKMFLTANYDVPEERLIIFGYGESMPVASNDNPAGKQKNRRVEIVVSD